MTTYLIIVIIALIVAYFCGSIPVGLIVGKATGGIDIREHGSGNTGTTNALRTMGWGPGLLVFAGDVLKGALGCLIVSMAVTFSSLTALAASATSLEAIQAAGALVGEATTQPTTAAGFDSLANALLQYGTNIVIDLPMAIAIIVCVLGHMFSPFMGFKGGKGIATALGAVAVVLPFTAVCSLAVFAVFAVVSRMVSVGSIAAVITVPIFTAVFYGGSLTYIIFAILLAVVAVLAHHKNIRRIAKGEEPRFSVGKKNTAKRK